MDETLAHDTMERVSAESPEGTESGERYRARLRTDMVRGSLWTLLAALISTPVAFVANLIVVRTLGSTQYAQFAIDVAAYTVVLTVANLGSSDAATQWIAAAHAHDDEAEVERITRICAGFHLLVKAPLVAIVTVALLHDASLLALALALAANVAFVALDTSTVLLVSTAANTRLAQLTLAMNLATQAALASTAVESHAAAPTWAARACGLVLGPLLAVIAVGRRRRYALRPAWPWPLPAGFGRYALAACSSALVAALLFDRTEIFVLQWRSDGGASLAVALFAVATTIARQLTVPMDALMGPLAPISAGLVASAPHRASVALDRALRVNSVAATITSAVLLPVGVVLVGTVFGEVYDAAAGPLLVLGLVSCLTSATSPLLAFALATRSATQVLRVNGVCLVVDVALALALIPPLGINGAVIAFVAAQAIAAALLVALIARRLDRTALSLSVAMRGLLVGPLGLAAALLVSAGIDAPVLRGVVCALVGAATLVLAWRAVPALRLDAADVELIEAGLPRRLAGGFVRAVRAVRLV